MTPIFNVELSLDTDVMKLAKKRTISSHCHVGNAQRCFSLFRLSRPALLSRPDLFALANGSKLFATELVCHCLRLLGHHRPGVVAIGTLSFSFYAHGFLPAYDRFTLGVTMAHINLHTNITRPVICINFVRTHICYGGRPGKRSDTTKKLICE